MSTPELPRDFQMRVPEGIARSGDSTTWYHEGKPYRVTIRFDVKLEDDI